MFEQTSLGCSTSPEALTRVADQAPAAVREVEAQKSYLRGAYRDPDQAGDVLDELIARSGDGVPGLSKAALGTLKAVQTARLTAEIPREGERYDAKLRRREELVSAAWREGCADPRVANAGRVPDGSQPAAWRGGGA